MEIIMLLVAIFLLLWLALLKHLPGKPMQWFSLSLTPVVIIAAIVFLFITKRTLPGFLMIIALFSGMFLYLREVKRNKEKVLRGVVEWGNTIKVSVIIAVFIITFIMQSFAIPSGSMRNTFLEGDHLFVNKFVYGIRIPMANRILVPVMTPRRGDLVVFWPPIEDAKFPFIKRCMGLPGDTLEMRLKELYINGKLQEEPYVIHSDPAIYRDSSFVPEHYRKRDNFGPVTIKEGTYFMMGDNRDSSYDSRYWGTVKEGSLRGKAIFTYWPLSRAGNPN